MKAKMHDVEDDKLDERRKVQLGIEKRLDLNTLLKRLKNQENEKKKNKFFYYFINIINGFSNFNIFKYVIKNI